MSAVTVSRDGDTWTLTTEGGSLALCDYGNGTALVGDWECDGSDPWAALRLYRAMDSFAAYLGLDVSIHTDVSESEEETEASLRLDRFYKRMGWSPSHIIYKRKDHDK